MSVDVSLLRYIAPASMIPARCKDQGVFKFDSIWSDPSHGCQCLPLSPACPPNHRMERGPKKNTSVPYMFSIISYMPSKGVTTSSNEAFTGRSSKEPDLSEGPALWMLIVGKHQLDMSLKSKENMVITDWCCLHVGCMKCPVKTVSFTLKACFLTALPRSFSESYQKTTTENDPRNG